MVNLYELMYTRYNTYRSLVRFPFVEDWAMFRGRSPELQENIIMTRQSHTAYSGTDDITNSQLGMIRLLADLLPQHGMIPLYRDGDLYYYGPCLFQEDAYVLQTVLRSLLTVEEKGDVYVETQLASTGMKLYFVRSPYMIDNRMLITYPKSELLRSPYIDWQVVDKKHVKHAQIAHSLLRAGNWLEITLSPASSERVEVIRSSYAMQLLARENLLFTVDHEHQVPLYNGSWLEGVLRSTHAPWITFNADVKTVRKLCSPVQRTLRVSELIVLNLTEDEVKTIFQETTTCDICHQDVLDIVKIQRTKTRSVSICHDCIRHHKGYYTEVTATVGKHGRSSQSWGVELEMSAHNSEEERAVDILATLLEFYKFEKTNDSTVYVECKSPIFYGTKVPKYLHPLLERAVPYIDGRRNVGTHIHVGVTEQEYAQLDDYDDAYGFVLGLLSLYIEHFSPDSYHVWGRKFTDYALPLVRLRDRYGWISRSEHHQTMEFRLPRMRSVQQFIQLPAKCIALKTALLKIKPTQLLERSSLEQILRVFYDLFLPDRDVEILTWSQLHEAFDIFAAKFSWEDGGNNHAWRVMDTLEELFPDVE